MIDALAWVAESPNGTALERIVQGEPLGDNVSWQETVDTLRAKIQAVREKEGLSNSSSSTS